jgi:hypothetical protein
MTRQVARRRGAVGKARAVVHSWTLTPAMEGSRQSPHSKCFVGRDRE